MDNRKCKNCKYGDFQNEAKGVLYCRRMPPAHEPMTWPLVWKDDWCGEFKTKEESDEHMA